MTADLSIRNRQRLRRINRRLLRELTLGLLERELRCSEFNLCVHLVAAGEMARINETFLHHDGSTDVITFDYTDAGEDGRLSGEIFISIEDAIAQARRFRTTWQEEVARYLLHGLLHLSGYDDVLPVARKKMKREENRLLRALKRSFRLARLAQRADGSR